MWCSCHVHMFPWTPLLHPFFIAASSSVFLLLHCMLFYIICNCNALFTQFLCTGILKQNIIFINFLFSLNQCDYTKKNQFKWKFHQCGQVKNAVPVLSQAGRNYGRHWNINTEKNMWLNFGNISMVWFNWCSAGVRPKSSGFKSLLAIIPKGKLLSCSSFSHRIVVACEEPMGGETMCTVPSSFQSSGKWGKQYTVPILLNRNSSEK